METSPKAEFRARVVDIDVGARRVVDFDVFRIFRGCMVRLDVVMKMSGFHNE